MKRDDAMKKLLDDYNKTAKKLYSKLLSFKKNKQNTKHYFIILSEYQHTCFVIRQIKNYCKARDLL